MVNREEISELIFKKINDQKENLKTQFSESKNEIGYFFIDDLLPKELALQIFKSFPKLEQAVKKKNLREFKYTAFQMDKYDPILEDVIYAFQDKKIVTLIGEICSINSIFADDSLYAGGLSLMGKDNFLNPHLDNSHDKDRNRWRVLNLLYYVSPEWQLENGGNLEIWNKGLNDEPTVIESKFNRLVVMATHKNSWHSVSKVINNNVRCCVSNYYFSNEPLSSSDTFHVTTFRAKKNEKIKDLILQTDNKVRGFVRKLFKKGVRENPHQYKK